MKHFLSALAYISGIILFPLTSHAQEQQHCFMVDAYGQPIDLSSLCGGDSSDKNALSTSSTPGVFQVPIKRREAGIPVIEVMFNGKHTFEMMLDTGASSTVLTSKMAETMGIKAEGVVLASTPSDDKASFAQGRVASVAVAGIEVKDLSVAISPSLDLGLLGQNFFANYDIVIKKDKIEFHAR